VTCIIYSTILNLLISASPVLLLIFLQICYSLRDRLTVILMFTPKHFFYTFKPNAVAWGGEFKLMFQLLSCEFRVVVSFHLKPLFSFYSFWAQISPSDGASCLSRTVARFIVGILYSTSPHHLDFSLKPAASHSLL
jgi:hypothetical protein